MPTTDELISLNEAADRLGVHYMTAYRYVRTGRLHGIKDGAEWRVRASDVEALRQPSEAPRPRRRRTDYATRLEERLLVGDESGAWSIIDGAMASGMDPSLVYQQLVAPAMVSVGERWANDEIDVSQEHLASAVVLRLIGRLGPRFSRRGRKKGTVLLAGPAGEHHGIPLAMVGDLLRGRGYDVADLGPDVPPASLARAVTSMPRLVAIGLCATSPNLTASLKASIAATREVSDVPVVVGGSGVGPEDASVWTGADHVTGSVDELLDLIDSLAALR
ncbi:MAG: B12-binding domain-containing protein [Acidimicrobiales bacterium]